MPILNPQYFQTLETKTSDNTAYDIVRPKDNPMILISLVDGSPLASLHLRCQNYAEQNDILGNRGRAIITKRPNDISSKCDFQGLIDKDNQEFELVITNLDDKSYINFNIMKTNESVSQVNPGGVNEINELRPGESIAVKCDQTDNKSLILSSIKKEDKPNETVTVKEDEEQANKTGKTQGTYFFLSVVPINTDKKLIGRFEKTEWKCMDTFIRKREQVTYLCRGGGGIQLESDTYTNFTRQSTTIDRRKRGEPDEEEDYDDDFGLFDYGPPPPPSSVAGSFSSQPTFNYEGSNTLMSVNVSLNNQVGGTAMDSLTVEAQTIKPKSKQEILTDKILSSAAAKLETGRHIDVHSAQTGIEYEYEKASVPCVISLSVIESLEFLSDPPTNELLKQGREMLKLYMQKELNKLMDNLTKVYESTECVICMDDDQKPDVVLYQCGHKCVHKECLTDQLINCPLCRCFISAKLG